MQPKRSLPDHYRQLIHWIEHETRSLDSKLIIVPTQQIGYEITTAMAALSKGWLNLEALPLNVIATRIVENNSGRATPSLLGASALPFLFEELLENIQLKNGLPLNRAAGSFARTISDLRMAGVSPDEYLNVSGGPFTETVYDVYKKYLNRITSLGVMDQAELFERARSLVADSASALRIDSIVILDQVELPEVTFSFVLALGERASTRFRTGASSCEPASSFPSVTGSPLSASARLESWAVPGAEDRGTENRGTEDRGTENRILVQSAIDPENEIRAVFRTILRESLRLDQVEIACTTSDPYVRIARHLSSRYNMPMTVATGFRAMDSRAGALANSYLSWIRDGKQCLDLVRILRSGMVWLGGRESLSIQEVGRMANMLATMPVSGDSDRYRRALSRIRTGLSGRVEVTRGTFLEQEAHSELQLCDKIEARIFPLIDLANKISGKASPADMHAMLSTLLYSYAPISSESEDVAGNIDPEFVARQELIARFEGLATQLEIKLPEDTIIARSLEVISGAIVYARSARSGKLHLSPLSSAGYTGRPHLFVVGLDNNRAKPSTAEDPLFSDREKDKMGAQKPTRLISASHHQASAERNLLRQVISRFDGRIHLIYSSYDLAAATESGPAASLMAVSGLNERTKKEMICHSFVPHGVRPMVMDETDGVLLMATTGLQGHETRGSALQKYVFDLFPGTAAGFDAAHYRKSDQWTAFDGIVGTSGRALNLFSGKSRLSSSRLETLTTCPYQYFLKYVLRVRALDESDPEVWMDALTKGSIAHDVFQRFMEEAVAEGRSLEFEHLDSNTALIQQLFSDQVDHHEQLSEAPNPVARDTVLAEFELMGRAFLFDEARRAAFATPEAFEFGFGIPPYGRRSVDDVTDVFRLKLDGLEFNFTGWIDRIDRLREGGFAVTDYKTGSGRYFRSDNLLDEGKRLQWALYAFVVEQLLDGQVKTSGYLFPGKQDLGRRIEADPNLIRDEIVILLRNAGLMVNGGYFLPAADSAKSCRYCDYKRICGDLKTRKSEISSKIQKSVRGDILHETLTSWPYSSKNVTS